MKKFLTCLLTLLFSFCIFTTAFADENLKIIDNANLLTDEEEIKLNDKINEIIEKYNFDIVIYTTDSCNGKTVTAFADDEFDYGGYGIGENRDGMLFLLSMKERDWYISTRGYGIQAFTNYGIDYIGKEAAKNFKDANYYKGFETVLLNADMFLNEANTNKPYDQKHRVIKVKNYILGSAIVAGIISLISVLVMKGKMKNYRPQKFAQEYVDKGSFEVVNSQDIFMYSNVSKTKRAEQSSNSSGGSSTHTSSSGASHGGGGGKF